jgi:uncharacterized RDD family membrane protein YckC
VVYGGFWRRLAALALDTVLLSPLAGLNIWLGGTKSGFLLVTLVSVVVFCCFDIYLVKRYGGTPGKRILGLKIVKLDGRDVTNREAVLRSLPSLVLMLLIYLAQILAILRIDPGVLRSLSWAERMAQFEQLAPCWYDAVLGLGDVWFWGELIVLLTNKKRRALHDFIAGTVVIVEPRRQPVPASERLRRLDDVRVIDV